MDKKRKINKELYPSKWKEFCKKYGESDAIEYYYKFSRSFCEEKYILKYGKVEGGRKFREKKENIDRGMGLKSCIRRYGEKEGRKKFQQWKLLVRQNEDNFIKRHGKVNGKKKFKEFSKQCGESLKKSEKTRGYTTRLDYWIKKFNGNVQKAKEALKKRQQTSTIDKCIKKYGKREGLKKYQEINKKKAITLNNLIKKYGETKGPEKYFQYIEKRKYSNTKEAYIEKYGKREGLKKYREIISKRTSYIYPNMQSAIGLEFCEKINDVIGMRFKKVYYGENEYKFFIWEDGISIAVVDFYIKDINVVIEFYGDYWHRNPKKYHDKISEEIRRKDRKRIDVIKKKFGSKIFIVWEEEYRMDKEKTINKIKSNLQIGR